MLQRLIDERHPLGVRSAAAGHEALRTPSELAGNEDLGRIVDRHPAAELRGGDEPAEAAQHDLARLEMKDEPGEGGRRVDPLAGLEPTPLRCTVILLGEGLTRGRAVAAGIRRSMDA